MELAENPAPTSGLLVPECHECDNCGQVIRQDEIAWCWPTNVGLVPTSGGGWADEFYCSRSCAEADRLVRAWVRYVDGRLVVTWREGTNVANRPLTLRERWAWRLAKRVPPP